MRYKEGSYQNITNPAVPAQPTTIIEANEQHGRNRTTTAQTVAPPQSSPTIAVEDSSKGGVGNLGGELKTVVVKDSRTGAPDGELKKDVQT